MSPDAGGAAAPRGNRGRREEVLGAAVEVFHDKGYAGASIQDVADRVGVLKGSLYYYIDSKEDLLVSVFESSEAQARAIIAEVAALEAPALERLRAFVREWSLWHLTNPERADLYFNEWKQLSSERRLEVRRRRRDYERFVTDLLHAAREEGDAGDRLEPRFACFYVLSALNGLPSWFRREGGDPASYIAEAYAEMVVGMVRGKPFAVR